LVLVHTMGRVGSSSVFHGLSARFPEATVRHVHALNPETLATQVAKAGGLSRTATSVREGLEAIVDLLRHEGPVRIVTLVRDAVDRNLSAGFARLRRDMPRDELRHWLGDARAVSEWWAGFHDRRPFEWFGREVETPLGIDVYAHRFPSRGHAVIAQGRYRLLLMRSELDDPVKSQVIGEFLGVGPIPFPTFNVQDRDDEWGQVYRQFRAAVAFDRDYLDEVARSRYQRHFYSREGA
jgi:hypothetical protein